ncbi:MAG: hypothetical protein J0I41_01225 [Filimonas sp.]|nr:hypothetical protein [Filimonas sp.]
MKLAPIVVSVFITGTLSLQHAAAKLKIPIGNREVLHKVADLPDTEDYLIEKGESDSGKVKLVVVDKKRLESKYLDLATLHEEFNIAWIMPLWVTKEPRLVGYNASNETYYNLTDEQLDEIIKANNLDKNKLLGLGFYTRFGGKLVALLLIGLIIYGVLPSKKKTVAPQRV